MESYIAFIYMFGGNFAPRGYSLCEGQLLRISENSAFFSLIGTYYGGNERRNDFALPDFRGRFPMGSGNGPGLASRVLGRRFGSELAGLNVANMPNHTHTAAVTNTLTGTIKLPAGGAKGTSSSPTDNYLGTSASTDPLYRSSKGTDYLADLESTLSTSVAVTNANTGGSQPFSIIGPAQVVNFVICVSGIFPS